MVTVGSGSSGYAAIVSGGGYKEVKLVDLLLQVLDGEGRRLSNKRRGGMPSRRIMSPEISEKKGKLRIIPGRS